MTRPAAEKDWPFGIAPHAFARLQSLFDRTPGLLRVWIYGSRARGDQRSSSDIDLAFAHEAGSAAVGLVSAVEDLELIYRSDVLNLADPISAELSARIARDRKLFWEPRRHAVQRHHLGQPL
jgi:type III restriction enzyme